jgi:glutamate 5-kinase
LLYADQQPLAARKRWLVGGLQVKGKLQLDDGAVNVLCKKGKSLLPVGVKQVVGHFSKGDLVICTNLAGQEIARGLVNYSCADAKLIAGQPSGKIKALLGYKDYDEIIHRDNLVLTV